MFWKTFRAFGFKMLPRLGLATIIFLLFVYSDSVFAHPDRFECEAVLQEEVAPSTGSDSLEDLKEQLATTVSRLSRHKQVRARITEWTEERIVYKGIFFEDGAELSREIWSVLADVTLLVMSMDDSPVTPLSRQQYFDQELASESLRFNFKKFALMRGKLLSWPKKVLLSFIRNEGTVQEQARALELTEAQFFEHLTSAFTAYTLYRKELANEPQPLTLLEPAGIPLALKVNLKLDIGTHQLGINQDHTPLSRIETKIAAKLLSNKKREAATVRPTDIQRGSGVPYSNEEFISAAQSLKEKLQIPHSIYGPSINLIDLEIKISAQFWSYVREVDLVKENAPAKFTLNLAKLYFSIGTKRSTLTPVQAQLLATLIRSPARSVELQHWSTILSHYKMVSDAKSVRLRVEQLNLKFAEYSVFDDDLIEMRDDGSIGFRGEFWDAVKTHEIVEPISTRVSGHLDPKSRHLTVGNRIIELTTFEAELMQSFLESIDKAIPESTVFKMLQRHQLTASNISIKDKAARLREKLRLIPEFGLTPVTYSNGHVELSREFWGNAHLEVIRPISNDWSTVIVELDPNLEMLKVGADETKLSTVNFTLFSQLVKKTNGRISEYEIKQILSKNGFSNNDQAVRKAKWKLSEALRQFKEFGKDPLLTQPDGSVSLNKEFWELLPQLSTVAIKERVVDPVLLRIEGPEKPIFVDEEPRALDKLQFEIVSKLLRKANRHLTRQEFDSIVERYGRSNSKGSLKSIIARVRDKLRIPNEPDLNPLEYDAEDGLSITQEYSSRLQVENFANETPIEIKIDTLN